MYIEERWREFGVRDCQQLEKDKALISVFIANYKLHWHEHKLRGMALGMRTTISPE